MKRIFIAIFLMALLAHMNAAQLAFPGAEGYGKTSMGGRGGIVIYVTNLNDSGTGSLRNAIESYKGQKRTIVFAVSGNIALKSTLEIKYDSYITIAGQTAPGDGICIKDFPIKIGDSHDVIIRYLRMRVGDEQDCGSESGCDDLDALSIRKSYNIILDHCSLGWSIDDVLDLTVTTGYSTVQYCLLHEPLVNSKHSKGAHGYISGWDGNSYGSGSVLGGSTYHHNLLSCGASRTPRLDKYLGVDDTRDLIEISNNVIYNWSGYGAYGGENADVNWLNNYHKAGPETKSRKNQIFHPGGTCKMYVGGNYVDNYPDVTNDNSKGLTIDDSDLSLSEIIQDKPFSMWPIQIQSSEEAYRSVLAQVGAFLPARDAVDERIVNEVINKEGSFIDSPSEVGGWPVLNSVTAPTDIDKDGMPDAWEDQMGLNKNDASDRNTIASSGYTQLEIYLNSIEFKNVVGDVKYTFNDNELPVITWEDIYIGEDGYIIEKSANGGEFTELDTVEINNTSYVDDTFTFGTNVKYRIKGYQKNVIESSASDIIKASNIEIILEDTYYTGNIIELNVSFTPEASSNKLIEYSLIPETGIGEIVDGNKLVLNSPGELTISAKNLTEEGLKVSKKINVEETVSINEIDAAGNNKLIRVYPNPTGTGYVNLKFPDSLNEDITATVFDTSGKTLFNSKLSANEKTQLNYQFSEGVYFLYIVSENYKSVNKVVCWQK